VIIFGLQWGDFLAARPQTSVRATLGEPIPFVSNKIESRTSGFTREARNLPTCLAPCSGCNQSGKNIVDKIEDALFMPSEHCDENHKAKCSKALPCGHPASGGTH
jgi:hypothetical protein